MPTTKHVPEDRLLHTIKALLAADLADSVRVISCPVFDLPEDHQWHHSHYIEVHPDGLVELWQFDGGQHVMVTACQDPQGEKAVAAAPLAPEMASAFLRGPDLQYASATP